MVLALGLSRGAAAAPGARVLATIDGKPVMEGDVLAGVGAQLEDIEITRLEAQARAALDRQQTLADELDRLVSERVIQLEATARGIGARELPGAEVATKVAEPTDEEIAAVYAATREKLGKPLPEVREGIVGFVREKKLEQTHSAFVDRLRAKYHVVDRLEPLRFEVADESAPAIGPAQAPVTIVEFADLSCPQCAHVSRMLHEIASQQGDRVRVLLRHFPVANAHPQAQGSAEAVACAAEQGRGWDLADRLFDAQADLAPQVIASAAAPLGLDVEAWNQCLTSGRAVETVRRDLHAGVAAGVSLSGTPGVFVNGRSVPLTAGRETILALIADELRAANVRPARTALGTAVTP